MRVWPIGVALGIDAILVALHAANAIPVPPLQRPSFFLDVGIEGNLPTWWASVQLWTASLLLVQVASRHADGVGVSMGGVLLALLSLDETTGLHERLAAATRTGMLPVTGMWPYVLAPLLFVLALSVAYVGRRTWRSDVRASALLAGGLVLLVVSAAGVELLANVVTPGELDHAMQVMVEESGELIAGTMLLAGAYRLATRSGPRNGSTDQSRSAEADA